MSKPTRCLGATDKLPLPLDDSSVGSANSCPYSHFIYCSRNMTKSKLWRCFRFPVIWHWNRPGFSFKSSHTGRYVGVRRPCRSSDFLLWCNFTEADPMPLRSRLDWRFESNEPECSDDILIDPRTIKWVENCSSCSGSCSFTCWLAHLTLGRMHTDITFYDIGNRQRWDRCRRQRELSVNCNFVCRCSIRIETFTSDMADMTAAAAEQLHLSGPSRPTFTVVARGNRVACVKHELFGTGYHFQKLWRSNSLKWLNANRRTVYMGATVRSKVLSFDDGYRQFLVSLVSA